MAREQEETPHSHRLVALAAVVFVAVATALAFGRVFTGHVPTLKLLLAGVASVGLAAALERRSPLLAALVSAVGLLVAVAWMVFPHTLWYGIPAGRTMHAIGRAVSRVGQQAAVQIAPTEPLRPLIMAGITAVWTASFSVHALAIRSGSPLLAAVPPAALFTFAGLVMEDGPRYGYAALFLLAVAALLFGDGLRRVGQWGPLRSWSGPGGARSRRILGSATATRGARRVTAAVLGLALLVPGVLPGFRSGPVLDVVLGSGGDGPQIDPLVSVTSSLQRDESVELFRVRGVDESDAVYWRWLSLERFDGDTWTTADVDLERARTVPEGALLPTRTLALRDNAHFLDLDQEVTILEPPGKWLPMAYEPRSFSVEEGDVRFDPATVAAVPTVDIDPGFTYRVESRVVLARYGALQAVPGLLESGMEQYVQLPADTPPQIGDLARDIVEVAGADTPFEQVQAIQNYLTSPQFTYDETVSGAHDIGSLLRFLGESRRGFCQQFATAMAVLLRTLRIPARVAVGFTPGTWDPSIGAFRVSTVNAHAWVEVWFPGYGWLPFEPTPSRINPITERITTRTEFCDRRANAEHPRCQEGANPPGIQRPRDRQPADVRIPEIAPGGGAGAGVPAARSPRFLVGLGVAALVALVGALVPLAKMLLRRRRLRRAATAGERVLATYRVFTGRAADLGMGRGAHETPLEYAARLRRDAGADGHLERLTETMDLAAYSLVPMTAAAAREAQEDARAALKELRRDVPLLRRVAGLWRPGL
jgi:transglutaminase-like putative cysteine protease